MNYRSISIYQLLLQLMRAVAVVSSSAVAVLSTMLPLFIYYAFSFSTLFFTMLFLLAGAFAVHGVLTHAFNDYSDHLSGTDTLSPALLSGGSRVIQEGHISPDALLTLGKALGGLLLLAAAVAAVFGFIPVAVLLVVGVWAAASYSLPPFQFSYTPLAGEWLSLFPSIFVLGLAGPWLILGTVPEWGYQNAAVNALLCLAWVMVHHIPDQKADRRASPVKNTTVVWAVSRFGPAAAKVPALIYLMLAAGCALWIGSDRIWAAVGALIFIGLSLLLVWKMNVHDIQQVTQHEKWLLLLAMAAAIWLGLFI